MQQFPGQPHKFELKNSRPSDIALAAEAANFVMQRAAQNAYAGLISQVNSFNQKVNYYQPTPVREVTSEPNVVKFADYRRRNEAAHQTVDETEPQQQTLLDEGLNEAEILQNISDIHEDMKNAA
jgi:hypothetical protein